MTRPLQRLALAAVLSFAVIGVSHAEDMVGGHALSMFGDVKYGPDFEHFDYVDPNAPKGGSVKLAAIGTFDSLNPFILKGVAAIGSGQIYDTLLTSSSDEAFTEYSLLVESIDMPEDRSWVAFTLREEARWHDGQPVTVDDVLWTFETLTTKGNPFFLLQFFEAGDQTNLTGIEPAPEPTNRREQLLDPAGVTGRDVGGCQRLQIPRHLRLEHVFDTTRRV